MNRNRFSITEQSVTVALFVVVIFGLGLLSATHWTISSKTVSLEEKRRLTSCPHLRWEFDSVRVFPAGFDQFFNDRFAYRQPLLSSINLLKYKIFSYSSSQEVLVGKHDWLFFMHEGDDQIMRSWPPLSHTELENWVRVLESRRAWLAKRNIRYFLVIPPSKCSIYPELIPDAYTRIGKSSRMDQLFAVLKSHSRVAVVDVRPALLRAKPFGNLYFRTDTHWNRLGALVASQEIAKQLQVWYPKVELVDMSHLLTDQSKFGEGDLAKMMGLRGLIPEAEMRIGVKCPRAQFSNNPPMSNLEAEDHHRDPFATEVSNPDLPKVFCLRDSFMQSMQSFVSENCRRISYHWRFDFPIDEIKKEKPDVVIQEITERILASSLPDNQPEVERCANIQLPDDMSGANLTKLADVKVVPTN